MKRPRNLIRVALAAAALGSVAVALQTVSWEGSWKVHPASARVLEFDLEMNRFGLVPACYWQDRGGLLLLVPEALGPLEEAVAVAESQQVLAIEVESGHSQWRPLAAVGSEGAINIQWGLERFSSERQGRAILSASLGGGPEAELAFQGLRIPVPAYNLNFPAFGEPGWQLVNRYFGRLQLTVRSSATQPPSLRLVRDMVNSTAMPDLLTLATWLPGERFLVLTPRAYGERRVWLLGPIQEAGLADPEQDKKDYSS